MNYSLIIWIVWWTGTLLIVLSWIDVVSNIVGWIGFGIACFASAVSIVINKYWNPPRKTTDINDEDEGYTNHIILCNHVPNSAIVHLPGRKYPAVAIQGDTLALMVSILKTIMNKAKEAKNEDIYDEAEEIAKELGNRLIHYEKVLKKEGFNIPYNVSLEFLDDLKDLDKLIISPDGRLREKAIRKIGRLKGKEIPLLLQRVNDWVPQIRDAAREAIIERITPDYAHHFLKYIPDVVRLLSCARENHRSLVNMILSATVEKCSLETFLTSLQIENTYLRRLAFEKVVKFYGDGNPQMFGILLKNKDFILRLYSAKALGKLCQENHDLIDQYIDTLLADPFHAVRKEAVYILVKNKHPQTKEIFYGMLFDTNGGVRQAVRYYLSEFGETDFNKLYSDALQDKKIGKLVIAIISLGEIKDTLSIQKILSYFKSPVARLRKAVIISLYKQNASQFRDVFLEALTDPDPMVSKTAVKPLITIADALDYQILSSLFDKNHEDYVRINIIKVANSMNWWQTLIFFVNTISSMRNPVLEQAQLQLGKLFKDIDQRYYFNIGEKQREELKKLIDAKGNSFPNDFRQKLISRKLL